MNFYCYCHIIYHPYQLQCTLHFTSKVLFLLYFHLFISEFQKWWFISQSFQLNSISWYKIHINIPCFFPYFWTYTTVNLLKTKGNQKKATTTILWVVTSFNHWVQHLNQCKAIDYKLPLPFGKESNVSKLLMILMTRIEIYISINTYLFLFQIYINTHTRARIKMFLIGLLACAICTLCTGKLLHDYTVLSDYKWCCWCNQSDKFLCAHTHKIKWWKSYDQSTAKGEEAED